MSILGNLIIPVKKFFVLQRIVNLKFVGVKIPNILSFWSSDLLL